ncbi:matrix metalloprotease, partial [Trifolium medium]|nr:matrix metalloprotease [Trifolium medium]
KVKDLFQAVFIRWSKAGALKFTETKVIKDSDILIAFVKVDGKGEVVGSWDCISG